MNRRSFIKSGALLCGLAALGLGCIRPVSKEKCREIIVTNFDEYMEACNQMQKNDTIFVSGTIEIPSSGTAFPLPRRGTITITERAN